MERIIEEGLSKLGFTVGVTQEASTRLSVEVRSFEILNVGGNTVVDITAIVYQKGVKTFERTYKADAPGIPRAFSKIEEPVNLALADLSHQLLGDLEMLGALVSR